MLGVSERWREHTPCCNLTLPKRRNAPKRCKTLRAAAASVHFKRGSHKLLLHRMTTGEDDAGYVRITVENSFFWKKQTPQEIRIDGSRSRCSGTSPLVANGAMLHFSLVRLNPYVMVKSGRNWTRIIQMDSGTVYFLFLACHRL